MTRLSAIDLLVPTSIDQLVFKLILFTFFTKPVPLMKAIVLMLPLLSVFIRKYILERWKRHTNSENIWRLFLNYPLLCKWRTRKRHKNSICFKAENVSDTWHFNSDPDFFQTGFFPRRLNINWSLNINLNIVKSIVRLSPTRWQYHKYKLLCFITTNFFAKRRTH